MTTRRQEATAIVDQENYYMYVLMLTSGNVSKVAVRNHPLAQVWYKETTSKGNDWRKLPALMIFSLISYLVPRLQHPNAALQGRGQHLHLVQQWWGSDPWTSAHPASCESLPGSADLSSGAKCWNAMLSNCVVRRKGKTAALTRVAQTPQPLHRFKASQHIK